MSFADKVAESIPAEVRMISGCHDVQTSADANITAFELPDPAGRRGGERDCVVFRFPSRMIPEELLSHSPIIFT